MKTFFCLSLILYISLFLLGYGRFLPFPSNIGFLHNFFSDYGFILTYLNIIPLIGFFIFRLIQSFRRASHNKYEVTLGFSALIIYVCFWFLIPTFKTLNHQLIMFVNKERTVENFSNPVLGYRMKIGKACDLNPNWRPAVPDNTKETIIIMGHKIETTVSPKSCEVVKYVEFQTHEFGFTETIDKIFYLPPEIKSSEIKYLGSLKSDYKDGWYYVQWSMPSTMRLF